MKTARFWHKIPNGQVQCDLCPHHCRLSDGKTGLCRVRTCRDGELKADCYGLISSAAVDPIEKKPLYHFHPGSRIFSFGGWGCNFACEFCQNWTISQQVAERQQVCDAENIVAKAASSGSTGIAYTYNEPLIGYEFIEECATLGRERGLVNVLVTNGYIEPSPASGILSLIDALNIDIKSMDDEFYHKRCRGSLAPVLSFAVQAVKTGAHVEITNLIIPTLNDDMKLIGQLAKWIKENLGWNIPLHLSGYHPQHRVKIPSTTVELLERAFSVCSEHLAYVYLGNVCSDKGSNTICPKCGNTLILRQGYNTRITGVSQGACTKCSRIADLIGL